MRDAASPPPASMKHTSHQSVVAIPDGNLLMFCSLHLPRLQQHRSWLDISFPCVPHLWLELGICEVRGARSKARLCPSKMLAFTLPEMRYGPKVSRYGVGTRGTPHIPGECSGVQRKTLILLVPAVLAVSDPWLLGLWNDRRIRDSGTWSDRRRL